MEAPAEIMPTVARMFSVLRIDYMIEGSMAMRAYVPARTTYDTDIVVRMNEIELAQLYDELGEAWLMDWDTAVRCLASRSMCNVIHYGTSWKLDVIPLRDEPFQQAEFERRKVMRPGAAQCFVQSLEDLILSKLQWARRGGSLRQLEDVKQLLKAGLALDEAYLAKWAPEIGVQELLQEVRLG